MSTSITNVINKHLSYVFDICIFDDWVLDWNQRRIAADSNHEVPMSTPDHTESEGCDDAAAKNYLKRAESELQHAVGDLEKAETEVREAEADVHKAELEVEEAEHRDHEIEVKVDGQPKRVKRGTYLVSAFKLLVGVAADRELDVVDNGVFKPLEDGKEITIHECEVFVSHARTGASS
jgi:hypothetical protein